VSSAQNKCFVIVQSYVQADDISKAYSPDCDRRRNDVCDDIRNGIATQCEITRLANRAVIGESKGIDDGSSCEVVVIRDGLEFARESESCVRARESVCVPVVGFRPVAASTAAVPSIAAVGGRT
jgi:hypothetical protein